MMLEETCVLRGYDSVLEIRRDSAQWNEFVSFAIRRVVKPGLEAALRVHRSSRRIYPPGGNKDDHCQRPNKRQRDEKPLKDGSENAFPRWGFGKRILVFSHTSE